MRLDQRPELGHDRAVAPETKDRLDPPLNRLEPELLETPDLGLGKLRERELRERRPTPEGERVLEGRERRRRRRLELAPAARGKGLESECVDPVLVVDPEEVAGRLSLEGSAAACLVEEPPQMRDVPLQGLRGRDRRRLAPQGIHQGVGRDDLTAAEQQDGEERALSPGRKLHRLAGIVANLERAKDPELHTTSRLASLTPCLTTSLPGPYRPDGFLSGRAQPPTHPIANGRAGHRRRNEMKAHRFGITIVAVASVATAIGAGAATTGNTPPWLKALNERSEALNREYGWATTHSVGSSAHPARTGSRALEARSEAMNRYYGLGEYAREGAGSASSRDWLAALNARSEALNRQYGLGEYGPKRDAGTTKADKGKRP